ncbi:MAG: hypothetical protein PHR66_13460 [Desulfuromonadaceae bacterium]|nr:hypothetical protein [Desulfuromonadaceae bacterium]
MRIAITFWNGRVSPVFDVTGQAMLFDAAGINIASEQMLMLPHALTIEKLACLREALTDVLVCGAISCDAHSVATNAGIRVYPFIAGEVREVLQACLAGRLEEGAFAMPGCSCNRVCQGGRNQGRRRGRVTGSAFFCKQEPDKKEV